MGFSLVTNRVKFYDKYILKCVNMIGFLYLRPGTLSSFLRLEVMTTSFYEYEAEKSLLVRGGRARGDPYHSHPTLSPSLSIVCCVLIFSPPEFPYLLWAWFAHLCSHFTLLISLLSPLSFWFPFISWHYFLLLPPLISELSSQTRQFPEWVTAALCCTLFIWLPQVGTGFVWCLKMWEVLLREVTWQCHELLHRHFTLRHFCSMNLQRNIQESKSSSQCNFTKAQPLPTLTLNTDICRRMWDSIILLKYVHN